MVTNPLKIQKLNLGFFLSFFEGVGGLFCVGSLVCGIQSYFGHMYFLVLSVCYFFKFE